MRCGGIADRIYRRARRCWRQVRSSVLLVESDSQAMLTRQLRIEMPAVAMNLADALAGGTMPRTRALSMHTLRRWLSPITRA